jgi:ABC-2 type transport system ATP-binding protein
MNNIISIKNVNKSFNQKVILQDINLDVNSNQIFGLIGLNGAGKTSIIKIILNLFTNYEGEVLIDGLNSKEDAARKNIYYLPEKFMPSASLTGLDFIDIINSFYTKEKLDANFLQEICEIISFPYEVLNNKISTYSKGMSQKIGIIAAFISKAKILILDEPMSGLDPLARIKLKSLMKKYILNNEDKLIFFSSHILNDVNELCDNVAVIHGSKLLFNGKPAKLMLDNKTFEESFISFISSQKND